LYRGLTLDGFQERAIASLEAGRSVLVSAPTGTGKTVIADWIVERALGTGRRVIYTAPVKALSNQKFRDWTRQYGESSVGLVTGDIVIRREAPCLVMTTEILRNMLLTGDRTDDVLAVVLDEIHFLDDRERGTVWEEVLIYLPPTIQVIGLSATLPNLDELAAWMESVRAAPVDVIVEPKRAVPLELCLVSKRTGLVGPRAYDEEARMLGPRRHHDRDDRRRAPQTSHLDVFRVLRDEDLLPYLYFVFSRKNTELFARRLARTVTTLLSAEEHAAVVARISAAAPTLGYALTDELYEMYTLGIAFHHAGLHVHLKTLVEELYEARLLKVLYCTSTFALGVNMPARAVAFDELMKFDGTSVAVLGTRQFMQKAGRAGRRGMDTVGVVAVRMEVEDWSRFREAFRRYHNGEYEPVQSSFNLSWSSIVLLLAAHDLEGARRIVERSFLAWKLDRAAEKARTDAARLRERISGGETSKRDKQTLKRLKRTGNQASERCWNEFLHKVQYLQELGYLDPDLGFQAGARLLQHLQISEILVAELYLEGVFEGLDDATLFGLLCALSHDLPRGVERLVSFTKADKALVTAVERVRRTDRVKLADEIAGAENPWEPDLLPIGRMWAAGRPLSDVMAHIDSATDISGTLIAGFRRAKDLCGQLRDAVHGSMPERAEQLTRVIRAVSRDEVEVVA
jgi:superfamily II RNA helicase